MLKSWAKGMRNAILRNYLKVIPLKLFYYQFKLFLKLGIVNIHEMNIGERAQPQRAVARILKGAQVPKFFLKL